jgi:predicted nucleotidyltransferase component of viral defense system
MGFNTIFHESVLINILKDIYLDEGLRSIIGFKGGTAAKLFYGLNRFSVDLDFDLLDNSKKEEVFGKIKSILEKYGVVKKFNIKRYTLFFLLDYKKKDLLVRNIKLEINTRKFDSKYERISYLGVLMNVMCKEDMFAHKFVAMYERMGKTNRDIYDVHFFLENM